MFDPRTEFGLEVFESGLAIEGAVVAEEADDDVGFEFVEPLVGGGHSSAAGVAGAPAVSGCGEGRVEFFGTREGPRIGAGGVGAEAGGVSFIAEVADEEVFFGVLEVEASFESSILHHAGAEPIADEDDAGAFFEFEWCRECRENG